MAATIVMMSQGYSSLHKHDRSTTLLQATSKIPTEKGPSRARSAPGDEFKNARWTGTMIKAGLSRSQTSTPSTTLDQDVAHSCDISSQRLSAKRRCSLQLPLFDAISPSAGQWTYFNTNRQIDCASRSQVNDPSEDLSIQSLSSVNLTNTITPPTPPPEDTHILDHDEQQVITQTPIRSRSTPTGDQPDRTTAAPSRDITERRVLGIAMPDRTNLAGASQLQRTPWIEHASRTMVESLNSGAIRGSIQVISQTLPSQARDSRNRPTFEELIETLQADLHASPYITITHAVPQARIMEELPKTPPTTPSFRRDAHDYFGNDTQTIFTHAAVVPIYHTYDRSELDTAGRIAHNIAAPCCVSAAILERYIPPTRAEEISDFFSISSRSYLVDRLSELTIQKGSLLLIYPTKAGGRTFTQRYLGPLIDPLLRRFVMLNSLAAGAANLMGTMTAVDSMLSFEEMEGQLKTLCDDLTSRSSARGPKSVFQITYAETAGIVLDRRTWINWYVEQEQFRLRQNLVDYHQAGGRMPPPDGHREITINMLIRDFIETIHKSQEPCGDHAIEVGVFMITRSGVRSQ